MEHNQTESQIEDRFIRHLKGLGYVHRTDIKDRASLEENFRNKFEALNGVRLTDGEFERLMRSIISSDVYEASKTLRDKGILTRDDGTTLYYSLVNLQNWCKNEYEVINQLRINTHSSHHRYDVIILINGLPLVQVELKTHGVSPRVAIKQIVDYKNDRGNGYEHTLLAFMQLFIVSNEADTFYFANNPKEALTFDEREQFLPVCRWANEQNKKVTNLHEFAREVLYKCALGELVSRYMVLVETERKLIIMRPYQIYAVKKMVECIENNAGNGYIWHTTGSGKTLTSFKAATLLKDNPHIAKCFFVVDRKDLDKQTREEFNKFQKDCVEENTNTGKLVQRMLSNEHKDKIIVTTIQKLGLALDEKSRLFNRGLRELADQRVVFIFDECHRSQFGEYHRAIKSFFPRAQLFGFTGTPIFAKNATRSKIEGREASALTTEDIFHKPLHTYAITHAIEDKSVLPFDVSFYRLQRDGSFSTGEVPKKVIVKKILEVHDKISDDRRFNALFATASINDAIEYCRLFDDAQFKREEQDSSYKRLRIACLFSPPAEGNRDIMQIQEELEQERQDNQVNPLGKKEALRRIISIYRKTYGGNFCIEEFDRYNCDVQERIKKQGWDKLPREEKIDITIVVDMLLTGFDSKYLGILYVDKGLQYHGLIQAFSRTNRVLNDRKPFGKILDFRAQSADALNTAVELFSGERDKTKEVTKIWLVESAHEVVQQFEEAVRQFRSVMESHGLAAEPEEVPNLAGDIAPGRVRGAIQRGAAPQAPPRPIPRHHTRRPAADRSHHAPRKASGLPHGLPRGGPPIAPKASRRLARQRHRARRHAAGYRLRARPLRLRHHRLRLHHHPHRAHGQRAGTRAPRGHPRGDRPPPQLAQQPARRPGGHPRLRPAPRAHQRPHRRGDLGRVPPLPRSQMGPTAPAARPAARRRPGGPLGLHRVHPRRHALQRRPPLRPLHRRPARLAEAHREEEPPPRRPHPPHPPPRRRAESR